jgi:TrmH family RNA methyltransferase
MHYSMPISQRLKKLIKSLHHKQFRDQNGLFIAEGEKLSEELLKSEYNAELIVIRDSPNSNVVDYVEKFVDRGVAIYTAPKHQFDQICDAKTPQSILAVVSSKEMKVIKNEPFIALDGISDPGNLGTIIRTADWFGVKQIILGPECADSYNPKTVRSTMGSIFNQTVVRAENLKTILEENFSEFDIFGASVDADKLINQMKPKNTKKYGIVFGSESNGLSEEVAGMLTDTFKIKGNGEAESLNVAIAAGISLYHFSGI